MSCEKRKSSSCACTYPGCSRHGVCCECVKYHNASGGFPACFFSAQAEKKYDRSYNALKKDRER